jgi:hypothetical protein
MILPEIAGLVLLVVTISALIALGVDWHRGRWSSPESTRQNARQQGKPRQSGLPRMFAGWKSDDMPR